MSLYVPAIDEEHAEEMLIRGEVYISYLAAGATADQFTHLHQMDGNDVTYQVFEVEFRGMV